MKPFPFDTIPSNVLVPGHYLEVQARPRKFKRPQHSDFDVVGFDLSGLAVSIRPAHLEPDIVVRVIGSIRDRETGELAPLQHEEHVDPLHWNAWNVNQRAVYVRRVLIKLLTHELDECLLVRGERIFDPHKGETP